MSYEAAIAGAVKEWLSDNSDVVEAALSHGAEVGAQAIALAIAKRIDKWFEANRDDLIAAIAGQMAAQSPVKPKVSVDTSSDGSKE